MPSQFPGVDPYIESWIYPSTDAGLSTAICDRLNPRLPKRFIASTELFVWRLDNTERLPIGAPDVCVGDRGSVASGGGLATIAAPGNTILPGVIRKQRYIKIINAEERRIGTVIESFSDHVYDFGRHAEQLDYSAPPAPPCVNPMPPGPANYLLTESHLLNGTIP